MVLHSADGMNEHPVVLANACDVRPHPRLEISFDCFATILGAEHNVNDVLDVRVGHVSRLRRSASYITWPQASRPGLNCRAPAVLRYHRRFAFDS